MLIEHANAWLARADRARNLARSLRNGDAQVALEFASECEARAERLRIVEGGRPPGEGSGPASPFPPAFPASRPA